MLLVPKQNLGLRVQPWRELGNSQEDSGVEGVQVGDLKSQTESPEVRHLYGRGVSYACGLAWRFRGL